MLCHHRRRHPDIVHDERDDAAAANQRPDRREHDAIQEQCQAIAPERAEFFNRINQMCLHLTLFFHLALFTLVDLWFL
jgi:hypothetical protein